MDVNDLLENFKVELTCSLCFCYFNDPATIPCGHSFCIQCLLQYWEQRDGTLFCPECRIVMTNIDVLSNRNLKNLSTIGKILRSQFLQSLMALTSCDQHWEKEKLFCEEDQIALCESCSLSPEHKDHQILPLEMAATKCKDKLEMAWDILKGKKEEFEIALDKVREREKYCKEDAFTYKRSVKTEYKKLHDFLWNEEYLCLRTLEDESGENRGRLEEKKAKILQQIQNLEQMLLEVEDNMEKAPLETFQEDDIYAFQESLMSNYNIMHEFFWNEEYLHLKTLDEEATENLGILKENKAKLFQQIQNLQQMILEVEDNLEKTPFEMIQDMKITLERNEELLCQEPETAYPKWITLPMPGMREMLMSFKRDITLDPETASPHLTLSDNLKSVTYGNVPNNLPDNNERLAYAFTVLGWPNFTSGKHYWEVEVGDKKEWKVGICEDSVITKGQLSKIPEDGYILEAFKIENDFVLKVLKRFRMSECIQKLGVYLDYEWGHLAFYNAEDSSLIYSPPSMVFEGPLRPYFSFCLPNQEGVTESLIICPWSNQ